MAEEKPVVLKKERKRTPSGDKTCIIHNSNLKTPGQFKQENWERIQNLLNIRRQTTNDAEKLTDICALIPTQYTPNVHGYHRVCYQLFINVKSTRKRSSAVHTTSDEPSCSGPKGGKQIVVPKGGKQIVMPKGGKQIVMPKGGKQIVAAAVVHFFPKTSASFAKENQRMSKERKIN